MIAVRPPEYFPRLAYLALGHEADRFVVADTFRYSRQSFQNRARLRTPQGRQWITIPLKGGQRGRSIWKIEIENREPWPRKHWGAFIYNYRTTPYFEFYESQFAPFFERSWKTLGELTCASVELLHRLYGLDAILERASSHPSSPATLPHVLEATGARSLLTVPEAAPHDAHASDKVQVLHFDEPEYRQNFDGFVPGLSAVDLLFNYGPQAAAYLEAGIHVRAFEAAEHDV